MGIQTVAIYSDADKDAPFVALADESYHLGASHVNESYLNVDKILQIAEEAEVEAIDRKSTRLNSSHVSTSYAVFCLTKKKSTTRQKKKVLNDTIHHVK